MFQLKVFIALSAVKLADDACYPGNTDGFSKASRYHQLKIFQCLKSLYALTWMLRLRVVNQNPLQSFGIANHVLAHLTGAIIDEDEIGLVLIQIFFQKKNSYSDLVPW